MHLICVILFSTETYFSTYMLLPTNATQETLMLLTLTHTPIYFSFWVKEKKKSYFRLFTTHI